MSIIFWACLSVYHGVFCFLRIVRLAIRTMEQVKKVHKWEGKPLNSLLNRIDIGVVPDKTKKEGWRVFVNEIEPQMTTWLGRYCPFVVQDKIAEVAVKQIHEMLKRSLAAKRKMPSPEKLRKLLAVLDQRLKWSDHNMVRWGSVNDDRLGQKAKHQWCSSSRGCASWAGSVHLLPSILCGIAVQPAAWKRAKKVCAAALGSAKMRYLLRLSKMI